MREEFRSFRQLDKIEVAQWELESARQGSKCSKGHEFTKENTGRIKSRPNKRYCKQCRADHVKNFYQRHKAEIAAKKKAKRKEERGL